MAIEEVPEEAVAETTSATTDQTGESEAKPAPETVPDSVPVIAPVEEEPQGPTDAELKHAEEAERAKNELIEEIRRFNPDQEALNSVDFENRTFLNDPRVEKFTVSEPIQQKTGIGMSTTFYTVTGVNADGEFSVKRRFKEFFALSSALRFNWPGVYIPSMPDKKVFNTTDNEVVAERQQLLEKFIKDCARYDYIVYSMEFKIFTSASDNIEVQLVGLAKSTPM